MCCCYKLNLRKIYFLKAFTKKTITITQKDIDTYVEEKLPKELQLRLEEASKSSKKSHKKAT